MQQYSLVTLFVAVSIFLEVETLGTLPRPFLLKAVVSSAGTCNSSITMDHSHNEEFQIIEKGVFSLLLEDVLPQILPCDQKQIGLLRHCPARSCQEVALIHRAPLISGGDVNRKTREGLGQFWVQSSDGGSVQVYCSVVRDVCGEAVGGWARIGTLNMADSRERCPPALLEIAVSARSCQRTNHSRQRGGAGCSSVYFPTRGLNLTRVCGRITGFQYGPTSAFKSYLDSTNSSEPVSIDDAYVDGVSVTFGTNCDHIWTLASARGIQYSDDSACPCTNVIASSQTASVPPWVGGDYFCDTASNITWEGIRGSPHLLFSANKLWDGEACWGNNSTCCAFNDPPWFHRQFGGVGIVEYVEVRLCGSDYVTDTPVQQVEIYVK